MIQYGDVLVKLFEMKVMLRTNITQHFRELKTIIIIKKNFAASVQAKHNTIQPVWLLGTD